MATKPPEPFLTRTWDYITDTQLWRSVFRHGMPSTNRNRALAVMTNVFLHVHPVKIRKSGIRLKFTWCMGGLTFFLFLVETFTGLLLMFYYRPTVAYAYMDIIDLAEHVQPHADDHGVGAPAVQLAHDAQRHLLREVDDVHVRVGHRGPVIEHQEQAGEGLDQEQEEGQPAHAP